MATELKKNEPKRSSYVPVGRVVLRQIGDDQLLVPVSGGAAEGHSIFPLNATGAFIWERLARREPLETVAHALSREFDVTVERANVDCREFVETLVKQGLLEKAR